MTIIPKDTFIMRTSRMLAIFIGTVVLISCTETEPPMANSPDGQAMHRVVIDTAIAKLSAVERQKLEHDAIERIVARAGESSRAGIRERLATGATISSASDPEVARLLGVIASARNPILSEAGGVAAGAAGSRPKAPPTIVRIALVKKVGPDDQQARVVLRRMPDDGGVPLLMVAESASSGEVEQGLRAAILSVKRNPTGVSVPSLLRFTKAAPQALEKKTRAKRILKDVREVASARHDGIGQAKVLLIGVR